MAPVFCALLASGGLFLSVWCACTCVCVSAGGPALLSLFGCIRRALETSGNLPVVSVRYLCLCLCLMHSQGAVCVLVH
eukprot:m.77684 g.77684  ORF g.77684 m.77684 type:complete len:78 (+) comp50520_c0_seq4:99-332(+)